MCPPGPMMVMMMMMMREAAVFAKRRKNWVDGFSYTTWNESPVLKYDIKSYFLEDIYREQCPITYVRKLFGMEMEVEMESSWVDVLEVP